jgi:hypothetical protein
MTMRKHLEDDVLLDVTFGDASVEDTRHADECPECGPRVAEARAGLALAAEAEAPEPSPLFWDVFRRRVAVGIAADRPSRRFRRFVAPALLATAATVAELSFVPRDPASVVVSPAPLIASSALPVAGDPGAEAMAASIDDLGCSDVADCVVNLSDDESRALAEALRADLAASGDL